MDRTGTCRVEHRSPVRAGGVPVLGLIERGSQQLLGAAF